MDKKLVSESKLVFKLGIITVILQIIFFAPINILSTFVRSIITENFNIAENYERYLYHGVNGLIGIIVTLLIFSFCNNTVFRKSVVESWKINKALILLFIILLFIEGVPTGLQFNELKIELEEEILNINQTLETKFLLYDTTLTEINKVEFKKEADENIYKLNQIFYETIIITIFIILIKIIILLRYEKKVLAKKSL